MSQFEFTAKALNMDLYLQQDDMEPVKALLLIILRECHDMNSQQYGADDLAEMILTHIQAWTVDGFNIWPEKEGSGPTIWDEVDAAARAARAEAAATE